MTREQIRHAIDRDLKRFGIDREVNEDGRRTMVDILFRRKVPRDDSSVKRMQRYRERKKRKSC